MTFSFFDVKSQEETRKWIAQSIIFGLRDISRCNRYLIYLMGETANLICQQLTCWLLMNDKSKQEQVVKIKRRKIYDENLENWNCEQRA
jgi:hypothetical protein